MEPTYFGQETLPALWTASQNLNLVIEKADLEWNEVVKDLFDHALDRFPCTVLEYMMGGRHTREYTTDDQDSRTHYSTFNADDYFDDLHPEFRPRMFDESTVELYRLVSTKFLPQPATDVGSPTLRHVAVGLEKKDAMFSPIDTPAFLREELEIIWDDHRCSDIRIAIPYYTRDEDRETWESGGRIAIFDCHEFLLKARSSYFRDIMDNTFIASTIYDTRIVAMPPTIVPPSAWEIVFCFISTGICKFQFLPDRISSGLGKALFIHRAAQDVNLPSLQNIISGKIIEILHGLFQASISSTWYDRLTEGSWEAMAKTTGCSCTRCAHCVPYVLRLLLERGIEDRALEDGARRALVSLFGPSWCTEQFSKLTSSLHLSILNDLRQMMTPPNIFSLLFAAEKAMLNLPDATLASHDIVRNTIVIARSYMDEVLQKSYLGCFNCQEWVQISKVSVLYQSGEENISAENATKLGWIVDAVLRVMHLLDPIASAIQQTLGPFYAARSPIQLQNSPIWCGEIGRLKANLSNREVIETSKPGFADSDHFSTQQSTKTDTKLTEDAMLVTMNYRGENFSTLTLSSYATADTHFSSAFNPTFSYESLFRASLISIASSRTASTDYGLFYTRLALSQDFMDE